MVKGNRMSEELRRIGIERVPDSPWGTHFCLFYRTQQDLLDLLVPYFKAGLERNEFCMWITSEPLNARDARAALCAALPDLDAYEARRQIEILDYTQWYTVSGSFDADRVLAGWVEKVQDAIRRGFDGLRLTGNTFWLEEADWRAFIDYEAAVDKVISQYHMIALCTYSLDKCGASEVIDVTNHHQFALAKRGGDWEMIESADRRRALEARRYAAELEQRVAERTQELQALNAQLAEENAVRQKREEELAQLNHILRQSEQRYRALFENISEGFALHEIICDERGNPVDYRFLDINPAFEKLTGLKRQDVIDKTARSVMPQLEDFWITTYGKVALTGEPVHREQYAAPLQQYHEVFAYRPAPNQFAVLFMNITERRRSEERIRKLNLELEQQAEELRVSNVQLEEALTNEHAARAEAETGRQVLQSLMQHAPDLILIADAPDVNIRMVAAYGERILGRPVGELLGVPGPAHPLVRQLFRPDGVTPIALEDLPIVQAIRRGQVVQNFEMILRRADGSKVAILSSAGPITSASGEIKGAIAIWRDITVRKEIEQSFQDAMLEIQRLNRDLASRAGQLEAANKELEAFTYSVSHDLRTPLTSVENFARMLAEECGEDLPRAAQGYLRLVRDNAGAMRRLIDGLLSFSRTSRQPLTKQSIQPAELVRQVLAELLPTDHTAEILVGELPPCEGDAILLKQVWANLISNALKFTLPRATPKIQVGFQTMDGKGVYFVRDNGVGFDMAEAGKLFGVFQRLHSEEDFPGTGVGLAIVDRIVRRHGGRVWAEAQVDQGATFYFTVQA